jgi:hypothetical protein
MGTYLQCMLANSSSSLRSTHLAAEYFFRRRNSIVESCPPASATISTHTGLGQCSYFLVFPILNSTFRLSFCVFDWFVVFFRCFNPYAALMEFRRQKVNHCVGKVRRCEGISVHHFTTSLLTSLLFPCWYLRNFIDHCATAVPRPTLFLAETCDIKEWEIAILKWFYPGGFWVMKHDIRS